MEEESLFHKATQSDNKMRSVVHKALASMKLSTKYNEANDNAVEAQHLLVKIRAFNIFSDFLWQINAMAVMLTGVAIKLVLYDPDGGLSPTTLFAKRLTMSVPMAMCFVVQLVHSVVLKNRHHWRSREALLRCWPHVVIVAVRLFLLGSQVALCSIIPSHVEPYIFLCIQSAFCTLQVILLEFQEHKFTITSDRQHPLARVPVALHTMRLKASQARMGDERSAALRRLSRESQSDGERDSTSIAAV
jgi:hypothetical protein